MSNIVNQEKFVNKLIAERMYLLEQFEKNENAVKKLSNEWKDFFNETVESRKKELAKNSKYRRDNKLFEKKLDESDKHLECPHCNSLKTYKYGKVKAGGQRYKCKECGKTFSLTTGTILSHCRLDSVTCDKLTKAVVEGLSVRKIAVECDIHPNTAFLWRQKIISAIESSQSKAALNSIIQSDETYFDDSFKGTKYGNMPRPAKKRGDKKRDNKKNSKTSGKKQGISNEKVCVLTYTDSVGEVYTNVSNLGNPTALVIEESLTKHVQPGSVLITDSHGSYKSAASKLDLAHIQIPSGQRTFQGFHIQNVNKCHSDMKGMNKRYRGVSTKHLNKYCALSNIVNTKSGNILEKIDTVNEIVYSTKFNIKRNEIGDRVPLPMSKEEYDEYVIAKKKEFYAANISAVIIDLAKFNNK